MGGDCGSTLDWYCLVGSGDGALVSEARRKEPDDGVKTLGSAAASE